MVKKLMSGCALAFGLALAAAPASAAPVLGSNVDSSVFNAALGSTAGWSYMGGSVSAFTGGGTAEVVHRSSGYANSFGYARTDHTDRVTLFAPGAGVGSTASVGGYTPGYLFYFQSDGEDFLIFSDDNRQYTDGFSSGGNPGQTQGDIAIFLNAALSTWAFFFDDGGGGLPIFGDDNDFDDLVVTFSQAPAPQPVPAPGALGLLGTALVGLAVVRRRQKA